MLDAIKAIGSTDTNTIRNAMCGDEPRFSPPSDHAESVFLWRRIQVRQLFRLALEATFRWLTIELDSSAKSTQALAERYVMEVDSGSDPTTADRWLSSHRRPDEGPASGIARLQHVLAEGRNNELPQTICQALALCLAEAPDAPESFEPYQRLPLARARREAEAWSNERPTEFVRRMIETWVLAQHLYWSVGRGLADARARGKSILRLRVTLEEGGWTLISGMPPAGIPNPTPDRLQTAISLAEECGLLER